MLAVQVMANSSDLISIHQFNIHRSFSMRSIKGIRILAADKNLGPTIVTESWYRNEVSRLLSDDVFYKQVDTVPFAAMGRALLSILERYGQSLGEKLKLYIIQFVDNHTPAHFKILPKVHKCPLVGRPIVASTNYLTTPASRFIDCTLSPCLPSLPSYIKDSSDLIRQLSCLNVPPECFLVTADVSSLYTNIPIKDCLTAIDLFCRSKGCEFTVWSRNCPDLSSTITTLRQMVSYTTSNGVWPWVLLWPFLLLSSI